jgi:hypothetical protein
MNTPFTTHDAEGVLVQAKIAAAQHVDPVAVIRKFADRGVLSLAGPDLRMSLDDQFDALCVVVQHLCTTVVPLVDRRGARR